MSKLIFNPEKDIKELEKYGWELDTLNCLTSCEQCKIENCRIKSEQQYYKSICDILHYTLIYVSNAHPEVYGIFDEYKTIDSDNPYYKYIQQACEEEIKANLIIDEEELNEINRTTNN